MLTKTGEIRRDEGCIDYAGHYVMVYPCHGMLGNQEWIYDVVCLRSLFICHVMIQKQLRIAYDQQLKPVIFNLLDDHVQCVKWVNHPLQVSQLGQLRLSSFRGR